MSDKQAILLKAGQHALAVDAVRAGVDGARHAIEKAKAELEAAKADYEIAKAAYESALDECEAAGIPKAKARKAIEALNQVWVEVGIVEPSVQPEQASADDAEKAARKKRRSKAEIEAAKAEEAAVASSAEAPATAQEAAVDFSAEIEEIEFIIDENLVPVDTSSAEAYEKARTLLKALAHAAASPAARGDSAGFDLETFRAVLDPSAAAELAANSGLPGERAAALAASLASDGSERVLLWFKDVLSAIEDGGSRGVEPLYIETAPAAQTGAAAAAVVESASPVAEGDISAAAPSDETVRSQDDFGSTDDDILPDYDEVLDDDRSFPLDGTAEDYVDDGEVVSDIGEINFLDETEPEAAEEPVQAPVETTPVEKPKPPRSGFAPPSFLKNK